MGIKKENKRHGKGAMVVLRSIRKLQRSCEVKPETELFNQLY